ncbi:MAG: group II intron maturase-specific domain-containing protein [Solirubrobacteraceae bacterium]
MEDTVENVNHVVRGWGNYFRHGNSAAKFSAIDSYAHDSRFSPAPSTD